MQRVGFVKGKTNVENGCQVLRVRIELFTVAEGGNRQQIGAPFMLHLTERVFELRLHGKLCSANALIERTLLERFCQSVVGIEFGMLTKTVKRFKLKALLVVLFQG